MKKPLLFDFDGTLVDSMPYWGGAMLQFLQEQAISYPDDIIRHITPLGNHGAIQYFQKHLGLTMDEDAAVDRVQAIMLPNYRDIIPLKEGVYDFLMAAKAAGHSLHVLTASPHLTVEPCLARVGVIDMFDNLWSCEDFATTKSDPGIYTAAAGRIGVDVTDCVFFDDNIIAVTTAVKAGMPTVAVYDESGKDFEAEMRAVTRYIPTFAGLDVADFA